MQKLHSDIPPPPPDITSSYENPFQTKTLALMKIEKIAHAVDKCVTCRGRTNFREAIIKALKMDQLATILSRCLSTTEQMQKVSCFFCIASKSVLRHFKASNVLLLVTCVSWVGRVRSRPITLSNHIHQQIY